MKKLIFLVPFVNSMFQNKCRKVILFSAFKQVHCKKICLIILLISCLGVNAQQILVNSTRDTLRPVMTPISMTDVDLFNTNVLFNNSLEISENEMGNMMEEEQYSLDSNRTSGGFSSSVPYGDGSPDNMLEKYNLKPTPSDFSEGLPSFSEDLFFGKVNTSIPLVNFEYYDYVIPVFLSNRYPQVLTESFGEPTFYLNSRVGGDWSLSVDQFKVTRQMNGIEDEHPTKGYFSNFSQSKVNNPTSISDTDILNGVKGDWDPAIDVFHFSTPTISGSFLIDINTGGYEILSETKFHVDFQLHNDQLHQFNITDGNGNKYLFGGDATSIEISQSITDVHSFGTFTDRDAEDLHVKYIIETDNSGNVLSVTQELPDNVNLFAPAPNFPTPQTLPSTSQIFMTIISTQSINSVQDYLSYLGNETNRKYYALPDIERWALIYGLDLSVNDPELKREKLNTAWYLKEITLPNEKKITFRYNNQKWRAYPTFASNKTQVQRAYSSDDFQYDYISNYDGSVVQLDNLSVYACFPQVLEIPKAPINESHTFTVHFVKKPELDLILDEEGFQSLYIENDFSDTGVAPYYSKSPSLYPNSPPETHNTNSPPRLIGKITYKTNNCAPLSECSTEIEFSNRSHFFACLYPDGVVRDVPWRDRSYLDGITIDGQKIYTFDYSGSRLKKINYPTGGVKEFFSSNGSIGRYSYNTFPWGCDGNPYIHIGGQNVAIVDKIVTTTEGNLSTEQFYFDNSVRFSGFYSTLKTFRPESATCTSAARLYSTSAVFNSHNTKSGIGFKDAKKYVNGVLESSAEHYGFLNNINRFPNTLYLTNETTPEYLDAISRPPNYVDERTGFPIEQNTFKPGLNDNQVVTSSMISRSYTEPTSLNYPSIYLTKIEVGPWQSVPRAIKRGYSTYFHPYEHNLALEDRIDNETFDSGNNLTTESLTFFERTRIPQLGLNNFRVRKIQVTDSEGNVKKTEFTTPIEVEGLVSTNSTVNVQNPIFDKLLSNNRVPVVESIDFDDQNITNASATEFILTPNNGQGNNFPVPGLVKAVETESILFENNFTGQHINPGNPGQIVFDSRLKDKIYYDLYDENGRLLEFHNIENGMYTSIIWGYKNQFPVVVAKNARYSEIESYAQEVKSLSHFYDTSGLISYSQTIRNALPDAQITTHTFHHKKLSSTTDVRGQTAYYEYDDLQRLSKTKDDDQLLLTKYRYHYRNVIDNPISAYISIAHNTDTNTVVFSVENTMGGSGSYLYSWNLVEGGTQNGSSSGTDFTVTYNCFNGDTNILINLTITDTNDSNNVTTLSQDFWDLDCCSMIGVDALDIDEIREPNDFIGLELKVLGLQGGCGPYQFNWKYRLVDSPAQLYSLITSFSTTTFVPENHPQLANLCQEDVIFECHIGDLGIDEPFQPTQEFISPQYYVDCSDNPQ